MGISNVHFAVVCIIFADAKAAEAAQSAYYDPNKPQTAYVPPPYNVSISIQVVSIQVSSYIVNYCMFQISY